MSIFKLAKNSIFLQNAVAAVLSSIHPSILHNIGKMEMLKKAFFHCELEDIAGDYCEFGIYEGTSLYSALLIHKKIKSRHNRYFYGFDSFDEGFKHFNEKDKHPFFKEGDFKSSFEKVKKRLRKFPNVRLVKGYFEKTLAGRFPEETAGSGKCAVAFIDCDLMSPALISLRFIRPILQAGGILMMDDFFAYKGDPEKGTAGALNLFLREYPDIQVRHFGNYGYGGSAFIVTKI